MADDPAAPLEWAKELKGFLCNSFGLACGTMIDPLEAARQIRPGTNEVDKAFDKNYVNISPDAPKEARDLVNAIGNLKVGPTPLSLKDVRIVADKASQPRR